MLTRHALSRTICRVSVLSELVGLIAPPGCALCRSPLPRAELLVCAGCLRALPRLDGSGCRRCGLPGHRGRPCPARDAAFHAAWAPFSYEGAARAAVAALKFHRRLALADLMAAQMLAAAPPGIVGSRPVFVPVPGVRRRVRARGFDPAELLAASLARRRGELERCLRRTDRSSPQVGRSRTERRRAGRLRFAVLRPPPLEPVLVDDVHTTGATLDAAAAALTAAGAERVVALTYARAA